MCRFKFGGSYQRKVPLSILYAAIVHLLCNITLNFALLGAVILTFWHLKYPDYHPGSAIYVSVAVALFYLCLHTAYICFLYKCLRNHALCKRDRMITRAAQGGSNGWVFRRPTSGLLSRTNFPIRALYNKAQNQLRENTMNQLRLNSTYNPQDNLNSTQLTGNIHNGNVQTNSFQSTQMACEEHVEPLDLRTPSSTNHAHRQPRTERTQLITRQDHTGVHTTIAPPQTTTSHDCTEPAELGMSCDPPSYASALRMPKKTYYTLVMDDTGSMSDEELPGLPSYTEATEMVQVHQLCIV